jgi:uncharacterized protein (TIGR02145 family)
MNQLSKICTLLILSTLIASCSKDDDNRSSTSNGCPGGPSTVTDIDGNVYNVVSIGSQCWMKENLKTTRYRNGDPITTGLSNTQWTNTTVGAWAYYENNLQYNNPYGKLYNWYAVADGRGVCPTGWHVPSSSDWKKLIKHLDALADTTCFQCFTSNSAAGPMKATGNLQAGTGLWEAPNFGATNSSGFTSLPSGVRGWSDGIYSDLSTYTSYWTSTSGFPMNAQAYDMDYSEDYVFVFVSDRNEGQSIRCIRD